MIEDSIYKKDFLTYLVGVSKDSLFVLPGWGMAIMKLNWLKNKFPAGIATLYLFDSSFKLKSERSLYMMNNNVLVKAATDKKMYAKRAPVKLNVSITDENHHPLASLFSVSVINTMADDDPDDYVLPPFGEANAGQVINNDLLTHLENFTPEKFDLVDLLKTNTYQNISRNILKSIPGDDTDSLLFIKGTILTSKISLRQINW